MSAVDDIAAVVLDEVGVMETMKLQKLLYYSQAWHLAIFGTEAFHEELQAWAQGPVVYDVWDRHRNQRYVRVWPRGKREGRCGREYCVGSVTVDLAARKAASMGRASCCEVRARELERARDEVQAVLRAVNGKGTILGLDVVGWAALGGEVGERFCAVFEHLHPDYGD